MLLTSNCIITSLGLVSQPYYGNILRRVVRATMPQTLLPYLTVQQVQGVASAHAVLPLAILRLMPPSDCCLRCHLQQAQMP